SMEDAPEHAFMSFVVTTFMNSLEQFAKLGFGKVENMLSKYQEMTLFQSVYVHSLGTPPLYLTVVGTGTCDLGAVIFNIVMNGVYLLGDVHLWYDLRRVELDRIDELNFMDTPTVIIIPKAVQESSSWVCLTSLHWVRVLFVITIIILGDTSKTFETILTIEMVKRAGALTTLEVPLRPLLGHLALKAAERIDEEAILMRNDTTGLAAFFLSYAQSSKNKEGIEWEDLLFNYGSLPED
ncbi:hypothetical protein ACTXT7_003589, partial [Hymenolepis weldensis]